MTALDLLSLIVRVLFVALFLAVAWRTVRQPTRSNLDATLLFGAIAGVVVLSEVSDLAGFEPDWFSGASFALINLSPLAMLLLVDDFRGAPRWLLVAGTVTFAAIAVLGFLTAATDPRLLELATITWFLLVGGYAAFAFAVASSRSRGLTRWRMAAVAAGACLFIGAVAVALISVLIPDLDEVTDPLVQVIALVSVLSFFAGFAPPSWLRRAWREPHLRTFLERSLDLSGVADDRQLVRELELAAADTLGAPGAAIGLADTERGVMRWIGEDGMWVEYPADSFIAGRAFSSQRWMLVRDATREDPEHAPVYQSSQARAIIAVPITVRDRRLGVLTVYGARAPIFAEDDLWLVQVLADHIGIILEARRMAREASELRAREETTLLKEEFLSTAAHDLRTPLTVLLGQAELLERRAAREPEGHPDVAGIMRIAREARRLRDLVSDLLDAQRIDELGPGVVRERVDLRDAIRSSIERFGFDATRFEDELPDEPLLVAMDRIRLEQVIDNLVENAGKYAGVTESTTVRAWREDGDARLAVVDHGIGIPEPERERVFERFFRASNVQARTDRGLGLGLYICRRIVESHGGRIWVDETPGGGSTFVVTLPLAAPRGALDPVPSPPISSLRTAEAEAKSDA